MSYRSAMRDWLTTDAGQKFSREFPGPARPNWEKPRHKRTEHARTTSRRNPSKRPRIVAVGHVWSPNR